MTWQAVLGRVQRDDWGRLLGGLIRGSGRPDLAEDALAEAFAQAAQQWPTELPSNPAGWLAATAQRRLIDAIRYESRRSTPRFRADVVGATPAGAAESRPGDDVDDRLALLFMATHPALAEDVRPALALRFVLGVPTAVIARLFLVPQPTMAARLTRAKRRLAHIGAAFGVPDFDLWPGRIDDVARAVYLGFTAGYAAGGEQQQRQTDASDAVRLAVLAADLMPGTEVLEALAALLLLHHARRDARFDDDAPVLLAEQDRSRWRRAEIDAGLDRLFRLAPSVGYAEELRLQALIAAFHATAATSAEVDWAGIARTYRKLEQLTGSPIVRLNRAVAEGEASGPMAGLAVLRAVGERLPGHHRVALVRAELLRRDGRLPEAAEAYRAALATVPDGPERRHIETRLRELGP